jgi:glycosyltransferase involved in cell wall biosynthesis
VQVVAQRNQGAAVARNTAYSLCQGDYIQWLDADDLLEPHKIEAQMRRRADGVTKRTLLSGAWGYFSYRPRKARFTPTALWADRTPLEWMIYKMGDNLHMQTDNWLVSRELAEAAGPWDERLWRDNDGEYFSRVMLACDRVKFVPEARSYYRHAGFQSISYIGGSNKKLESLFLSMQLHIQYIRSLEDSARVRQACVHYLRTWLPEFYPFRLDIAEQVKELATQLGGRIPDPRLSWKYDWIVRFFGWRAGRQAQLTLPRIKASARYKWDEAMVKVEDLISKST